MRPVRLELEGFSAYRQATEVDFADVDLFALTGPPGPARRRSSTPSPSPSTASCTGSADKSGWPRRSARGSTSAGPARLHRGRRGLDRTASCGARRAEAPPRPRPDSTGARPMSSPEPPRRSPLEVTELLGLTYDHFSRCVVLPQGEFARFLHDKPSDRQDLLVSLLQLGLYGRMAERPAGGRRRPSSRSPGSTVGWPSCRPPPRTPSPTPRPAPARCATWWARSTTSCPSSPDWPPTRTPPAPRPPAWQPRPTGSPPSRCPETCGA